MSLSLTVSLARSPSHSEKSWGLHQARAVCEWIAMLALVGYSLSFLLYQDHEADSARAAGRRDLEASLLPS